MEPHFTKPQCAASFSFSFLKEQLRLLQELAEALESAPQAVVASDLRRLELQTSRQRAITEDLRVLWNVPAASSSATDSPAQRRAVIRQIAASSLRAQQAARLYAALLRRAQRTNHIFLRLLASSAATYEPPRAAMPAPPGRM